MSKTTLGLFTVSLAAFALLLGLAIYHESTMYLYLASFLPIPVVLWLPDIAQHQYIRPKHRERVHLSMKGTGEQAILTITFTPGFVRWRKGSKLYFHLDHIEREDESASDDSSPEAALAVLAYDLSCHPRKNGWIGIDLDQLAARTSGLSFTTDEVTRFTIQAADVEQVATQQMKSAVPFANSGKQRMQA